MVSLDGHGSDMEESVAVLDMGAGVLDDVLLFEESGCEDEHLGSQDFGDSVGMDISDAAGGEPGEHGESVGEKVGAEVFEGHGLLLRFR